MSGSWVGREAPAADAQSRAASARRLAAFTLLIAACATALWLAAGWWSTGRFIEATDDAYVGGDITAVAPQIAGFVTEILVSDNDHVQSGALLARIDGRNFEAARDRARAIVEAREASLAILREQLVLQQSSIAQALADFSAKNARSAYTRIDGARYAQLALTSSGSRQDAQRTHVVEQEALASVTSSQAALAASRQQMKVLQAELIEAQATIVQARADLRRADLDIGYTEIRSPIEGYVGNRVARVGAYMSEGSYLLSIIPARSLWVDANFKEDQLARIAPGQAALITADAVPGQVFHGRVLSLAPATGAVFSVIPPENATGNFTKIVQRVPVRIALDAADGTLDRLRPGLSTTVRIDTRTRQ